jgi:hypothetical protein
LRTRDPILRALPWRGEDPRAVLQELRVALARNRDVILFARALVGRAPRRDRLARLSAVFAFVSQIAEASPPQDGVRDGVDWLLALANDPEGRALVLAALLSALGEKAAVEYRPGTSFVRVELAPADISRLPPHARLIVRQGRVFIPLDAKSARAPFAFTRSL